MRKLVLVDGIKYVIDREANLIKVRNLGTGELHIYNKGDDKYDYWKKISYTTGYEI